MKVVYFHRKPYPFHFSIEKVFQGIKAEVGRSVEVKTAVLPYYSTGFLPRMKSALWSRKHQGDINHITGDVHFIALCLDRRKTILTIHDLDFLDRANKLAALVLRMFWLILPLKRVAYVTVVSEATKIDLLRRVRFPADRVRVIPNYYDNQIPFRPKIFNQSEPVILQIGTKANKNIPRLIQALEGISCKLVIVGEYDKRLDDMLNSSKIKHTWTGRLSDEDFMARFVECDILAYISTIEGFGLPILEAQALGRVVVTSNLSSMPEVAGAGACLVDPYDVSSIREGILRVIADAEYREELIQQGLKNTGRFSLERVAGMYRSLYQEVHEMSGHHLPATQGE